MLPKYMNTYERGAVGQTERIDKEKGEKLPLMPILEKRNPIDAENISFSNL